MTASSDAYRAGRRARLQNRPLAGNPFTHVRPTVIRSLEDQAKLEQRWTDGWNDQDWLLEIEKEKNGKT